MKLQSIIKRGFLLSSAFAAIGCQDSGKGLVIPEKPTSKVEIQKEKFDFENAEVIRYADYNSSNIIAMVMDIHDDSKVQEEIFSTLEELIDENNAKMQGIEGRSYNLATENIDEIQKPFNIIYKQIIGKEGEEQWELIKGYCFLHQMCNASDAIEFVKADKLHSVGVEDQEVYDESGAITLKYGPAMKEMDSLMKKFQEGKLTDEEITSMYEKVILPFIEIKDEFSRVVVKKRSEIFVDRLMAEYEAWKNQGNESKVLMLTAGGGHYKTIAEYLDSKRISYLIIKPKSYEIIFENNQR